MSLTKQENDVGCCVGELGEELTPEGLELYAQKLREEEARLIAGWKALEAEQRRQLLENKSAGGHQASVAPRRVTQRGKGEQSSMDRAQQFRLVQRECDRQRRAK